MEGSTDWEMVDCYDKRIKNLKSIIKLLKDQVEYTAKVHTCVQEKQCMCVSHTSLRTLEQVWELEKVQA